MDVGFHLELKREERMKSNQRRVQSYGENEPQRWRRKDFAGVGEQVRNRCY